MAVLEEGRQFGRFSIVRWLGSGISGESYEAEDTLLQRKVMLKLIQPWTILSEGARRQFFREMQGISRLDHPYLAEMFHTGEINGRPYIVRRYVSNGSLLNTKGRQWFQPPLRVRDALRYGQQLAQALEYIHTQGYVHGSVTLANILMLRSSNIEQDPDFAPFLLADVGQAHFVRRFGRSSTAPWPLTAAPEQMGQRVTPASDQYALALLIYLWLAGRPPFVGTGDEIEYAKLTETIPALANFNSEVTLEQEAILRRALMVYAEERFPSVLAFADALMATLAPLKEERMAPIAMSHSEVAPPTERETEPQRQIEAMPEVAAEPVTEPQRQLEVVLEVAGKTMTDSLLEANPAAVPQPAPDVYQPLPQPAPEPLPEPAPEPLPVPVPEPLPVPETEPLPQPAPEPLPVPAPEPLPQPDPAPQPRPGTGNPPSMQDAQRIIAAHLRVTPPRKQDASEINLEQYEITIGRAGSSDVLLDADALVSRHHALIKREGNAFVLYDRRSANGVFVNGWKLPEGSGHMLREGDSIRIGNHELLFSCIVADVPQEVNTSKTEVATPVFE